MSWSRYFSRPPLANSLLLLSILLVIAPHLAHLPPGLSLISLGAIGWRGLHDTGRVPLPPRLLHNLLVILAIGVLLLTYHTLIGREAGTALLVLMLSLKLFELRQSRDVSVAVFLCFFVMVTAFLFSQSLLMAAYTLGVVFLLITTLISFQHPGERFERQALQRDLRLAGRLILPALPLALILFVLFPRIPGPLWGLPDDAAADRTGLSDELAPGRISRLADSNAVAFRVQFDADIPPASQRYWRALVMTDYDGRRWESDTATRLPDLFNLQVQPPAWDYQITLEPHNRKWLFTLGMPASIPDNTRLTRDYQLLQSRPITEVHRYRLRSHTRYRLEPEQLIKPDRYLDLPSDTAPQARQLVNDLRQTHTNPGQLIDAVLNHFAEQPFYYTREPPLLFDDPVDEFLFETRRGFCEHYASAFTVMMRHAGIPARIVTGYYGGQMNPLADYMIVRQSSAHAWSEVWLQGQGWVRIDPTAVIPPSRVEVTADRIRGQPELRRQLEAERPWLVRTRRQLDFAWDALNNRWQQWVIGYNQARQSALLKALGLEDVGWQKLIALLATILTLTLLIITAVLLWPRAIATDRPQRLYQRLLRKLARRGWQPAPGETPDQFCRRIGNRQPSLAATLEAIIRRYLRLRYASLDPEQHCRELKQLARSIRRFSA